MQLFDAKVATLNALIPIEDVLDYNKQFLSFIRSRVSIVVLAESLFLSVTVRVWLSQGSKTEVGKLKATQ